MVADWCCEHADAADVRKLWLFDNRLGDEGAAAVARILQAHPGECGMCSLRSAWGLVWSQPLVCSTCGGLIAKAGMASGGLSLMRRSARPRPCLLPIHAHNNHCWLQAWWRSI